MTDEEAELEAVLEEEEVSFVLLGPMYGWFCANCGQSRMGYVSKEDARRDESTHAMDEHAPTGGWIGGSRMIEVEWKEVDD